MSLESEIKEFIHTVTEQAEAGIVDDRSIAMARELHSGLLDYYDELFEAVQDGRVKFDSSVTIAIDGQSIKFQNENQFAEWLHEYTS